MSEATTRVRQGGHRVRGARVGKLTRRAAALGSALGLVGGQPAIAHTVYSEPTIFNDYSGSQCIKQKRSIWEKGTVANNVSVATTTSSKKKDFFVNCLLAKSRGSYKLGAWTSLFYGPGSSYGSEEFSYKVCWQMPSTSWAWNTRSAASMRVEANFSNLPCGGNRWYKAGSRSKWYYDGGRVGNKYYSPGYWEETHVNLSPAHEFETGAK